MIILVLEGLPASGKTTLANCLRDEYGFKKVNESLGYLAGVNLSDEQREIFEETLRKYHLAKKSNIPAIIDRGYPSLMAWDYCAKKLNLASDFEEKQKWINKALTMGELFEPYLYIYLKISPEISIERRPRIEEDKDVWSGLKGMNHCDYFYDSFFKRFSHTNKVVKINATLPIKEVVDKVRLKLRGNG